MQRIWDCQGALFVRSEEKVLSGNGTAKESPSKKLANTDAEEGLANAEVQMRGGWGQNDGKDFVSSTVVWLGVVGEQKEGTGRRVQILGEEASRFMH